MLKLKDSRHNALLATDIYGDTSEFKRLRECISQDKTTLTASPYQGQDTLTFTDEALAYEYFCDLGGIEHYKDVLVKYLQKHTEIKYVVGFSAGASALYSVISELKLAQLQQVWLFYPSQVRYMLDLQPKVRCNFIFPESELHFNLEDVIRTLDNRDQNIIEQTKYTHGFMNQLSEGFDPNAYEFYCQLLQSKLKPVNIRGC